MIQDPELLEEQWEKGDSEDAPDVVPMKGEKRQEVRAKTEKLIHDFMDESQDLPNVAKQQIEVERKKVELMEELLGVIKEEGGIPVRLKEEKKEKEVIEIDEDISREEAREKIIEFLRETPEEIIYPSDVFEELEISYELTADIMEDLESEDYLEEA